MIRKINPSLRAISHCLRACCRLLHPPYAASDTYRVCACAVGLGNKSRLDKSRRHNNRLTNQSRCQVLCRERRCERPFSCCHEPVLLKLSWARWGEGHGCEGSIAVWSDHSQSQGSEHRGLPRRSPIPHRRHQIRCRPLLAGGWARADGLVPHVLGCAGLLAKILG